MLGLGSQIQPHITKRFSMPWSHPAPRMRELVLAMRAIWSSWQDGTKLDFRGDFYTHTLMTPFFNPGPNPYGAPKVLLAAVGEKMTEVAGEVCDGIIIHGFTTERYVREVTMPAIERGLAKAGRSRSDFQVSGPLFVVTGDDEKSFAAAEAARSSRSRSTAPLPRTVAYSTCTAGVTCSPSSTPLSKQGKWVEMGNLITPEMLHTFAVVADRPEDVAAELSKRYSGIVDRCSFYAPYKVRPRSLAFSSRKPQGCVDGDCSAKVNYSAMRDSGAQQSQLLKGAARPRRGRGDRRRRVVRLRSAAATRRRGPRQRGRRVGVRRAANDSRHRAFSVRTSRSVGRRPGSSLLHGDRVGPALVREGVACMG